MTEKISVLQIERVCDALKSGGFEIPQEWDNDVIYNLIIIVIEALED